MMFFTSGFLAILLDHDTELLKDHRPKGYSPYPAFECAGTATKIDSFYSVRKRPRWELNLFLLAKRPDIGRLRSY